MDLLPLLPGQHHLLCRGREHAPGDDDRRVNVETADGPQWDGTWAHQSTQGLVWSLLSEIRSQGVWSKDKAWVELSDEQNVGGAWLRRQDDPRATFEEMWDRAYNTGPKLSFQQLVTVLVGIVEDQPGIQLVYLREAAARHGWRNRGDLDDLLAGLIGQGVLRDERTYGPSGKRCTSRRFWKKAVECAGVVAKTAAVTLSLALLAVGSTRGTIGQRNPARDRSFYNLLTDKKLRARGLRLLRRRLARLRPPSARRLARKRPSAAQRVLTDAELAHILDGLDLGEVEPPAPPHVAILPAGSWAGLDARRRYSGPFRWVPCML